MKAQKYQHELKLKNKQQAESALVVRVCPACGSSQHWPILQLSQNDFVSVNPTYDLSQVQAMGFGSHKVFQIVCCAQCGFQYSLTQLSEALKKHLYNHVINAAKSKGKIFNNEKRLALLQIWCNLFRLAIENAQQPLDLNLLDYGCGWGDFLAIASAPGVRCLGFETDTRKRSWARKIGINVIKYERMIDKHAPFEIIFCNQVLEHVSDPNDTLAKLSSWLKVGGYGWLSVPDCGKKRIKEVQTLMSQGQPIPKEFNPWEHLNYFSPKSFVSMIDRHGLEVVPSPLSQKHHEKWSWILTKNWVSFSWIIKKVLRYNRKTQTQHRSFPSSIAVYIRKR